MIIECSACRTRFRLDESRIKGRGARVRCRRCGESIVVMKTDPQPVVPDTPARPDSLDLSSILRQPERTAPASGMPVFVAPPAPTPVPAAPTAAPTEESAPPVSRPEEPAPPTSLAVEPSMPPVAPEEPAEQPGTPLPDPGSAPSAEGIAEAAPEVTVDDFDRALFPAPPELAEPAEPPEPAAPPEPTEPAVPAIPGEFTDLDAAFERFLASSAEDEMLAAAGRERPAGTEASFGSILESAVKAIGRPDETIDFGDVAPPTPPTPPLPGARGALPLIPTESAPAEFLLSDADTVDFLKNEYRREAAAPVFDISKAVRTEPFPAPVEEDAPAGAQAAPPPAPPPPLQWDSEGRPPSRSETITSELADLAAGTPPAAKEAFAARPAEEVPTAKPAPARTAPVRPGKPGSSLGRPSVVALLLLFIALAGGGAYLGFTSGGQETLRRLVPGMESLWLGGARSGPRLEVGNLIGYYEAGTAAGKLFVVKGHVTNHGRSRKSGIRIHAALLDGSDRVIGEKSAYAGNVLTGDALRAASKGKIEEAMANRFGDRLVNMDVAPGKSIAFMVVFFEAPDGVDAYRLEAVDGE